MKKGNVIPVSPDPAKSGEGEHRDLESKNVISRESRRMSGDERSSFSSTNEMEDFSHIPFILFLFEMTN